MVGRPPEDLTREQALLNQLLKEPWNVDEKIFGVVLDSSGHVQGLVLHRLGLKTLPQDIGNLTRLQVLLAGYNQLKSLPETLGQLHRLEKLYLRRNQLKSLPDTFGQLHRLQTLDLSWNRLQPLPDTFGQLSRLQELSLWGNQLNSLPETFGNLSNLQWLSLRRNQLNSLPDTFGQLHRLQTLDLSWNRLQSLPETFGNLSNLQTLYLYKNQLNSLPDTFGQLHRLKYLNLAGNQLKSLLETFGNLSNLQTLKIYNNQLKSLPDTFGQLHRLETLWLYSNQLKSLPDTFGHLSRLQTLDLEGNQLQSLPDTFGHLSRLQALSLAGNQLKSLPETLGHLSRLQTLDLWRNQLKSLPDTFGQLSSLQHLELWENQLKSLPDTFGNLSNLQWLSLRDNQLKSLPETLGHLSRLQALDLDGNPLRELNATLLLPLKNLRSLYLPSNTRVFVMTVNKNSFSLETLPPALRDKNITIKEISVNDIISKEIITKEIKASLRDQPVISLELLVASLTLPSGMNITLEMLDEVLERHRKKLQVVRRGTVIFSLESVERMISNHLKHAGIVDCAMLSREWSVPVADLLFVLEHHVTLKKLGCERERHLLWDRKGFFKYLSNLGRERVVMDVNSLANTLQVRDVDSLNRIIDQWLSQRKSEAWRSEKTLVFRRSLLNELKLRLKQEGFVDLSHLAESYQLDSVKLLEEVVERLLTEKELKATRMGRIVTTLKEKDILRMMQSISEEWEVIKEELTRHKNGTLTQELLSRIQGLRSRLEALELVGEQLRNALLVRGVRALKVEIHETLGKD